MQYLIIERKHIIDAIEGSFQKDASTCQKQKIFGISSELKSKHIMIVWEDKALNSPNLIVVNDDDYFETLAYIDTYAKKYTPFTSFIRVVSRSMFVDYGKSAAKKVLINTDVFLGVIIADANITFGNFKGGLYELPLQAYLSTLSATIISSINSGCSGHEILKLYRNWRTTKELLAMELDGRCDHAVNDFWLPVISTLTYTKSGSGFFEFNGDHSNAVKNLLIQVANSGIIGEKEWNILAYIHPQLREYYAGLSGVREDGLSTFNKLIKILNESKNLSNLETSVILATALCILASSGMDYLSLAIDMAESMPLMPYWYMLLVGLNKKQGVFNVPKSMTSHIKKHLSAKGNLYSPVEADISYPELKVILVNHIDILPFVTEYNTVIAVEVYPTIVAKFRAKKFSGLIDNKKQNNGTRFSQATYNELQFLLDKASKILADNNAEKNDQIDFRFE